MTKVYAFCCYHNDADILRYSVLHHMGQGIDGICLSSIASKDESDIDSLRKYAESKGIDFYWETDPELSMWTAIKQNRLAARCHVRAGTDDLWLIPFDADEFWSTKNGQPLAEFLKETPADVESWWADFQEYINTDLDKTNEPNPQKRMHHYMRRYDARMDKSCCKVLYRWRRDVWLEAGAHRTRRMEFEELREDGGRRGTVIHSLRHHNILFQHYPLRSPKQMFEKYKDHMTAIEACGKKLPRGVCSHSRERFNLEEEHIDHLFYQIAYSFNPKKEGLLHD